jgi:hypothetical protein
MVIGVLDVDRDGRVVGRRRHGFPGLPRAAAIAACDVGFGEPAQCEVRRRA